MREKIKFGPELPEDIFNNIARDAAEKITSSTSQLRKFYDELVMWNSKVQQHSNPEEKYKELAPYIKMLNAKVAYASGRRFVDKEFNSLFTHCINQIHDPDTLKHCKLFIEALIGFRKAKE